MHIAYNLIVKGDGEFGITQFWKRTPELHGIPIDILIKITPLEHGQTQLQVVFDYDTESSQHTVEAMLNRWLTEHTQSPYPDGDLLFWSMVGQWITTDTLARARGIKVFDTAIPQGWAEFVHDTLGQWPQGHIVWSYDGNSYGLPAAVDKQGDELLARLV